MAFGLGRLRLPPETFWAASPREIFAASVAFAPPGAPAAPSRAAFEALMTAHPDPAPAPPGDPFP